MEFEDLKKIWDQQNNEPMYAINQEALHKRIKSSKKKASFASNMNEIGLVLIAVVTSTFLFIKNSNSTNIFTFLPGIVLLLTAVYVWYKRSSRKKQEEQFDRTMMGDLDHAISNVEFEIKRARTFIWWYLIPIAIPVFLNLYDKNASLTKWLIIIGMFILSYAVVQLGLYFAQLPKKRSLQSLRDKLKED
jgi:RsiW-degrading membrane proteinase PrsW (M82 family)